MGEEKKGFFSRLKEGLSKTRNNIVYGIDGVFNGFSNIDEDFYEELEEILIMGMWASGRRMRSLKNSGCRCGNTISRSRRTARNF